MKPLREEILGQLLFLRLDENRWSASLDRLLRASLPGGVLLAAPFPRSPALTREFLHKITRSLPKSPFLAVREEGGPQDPLRQFLPPLPSPRAVAEKGLFAVARLGDLIGEALSLLGINSNFAPLLDLATPFTEKTLGARTFGADPQQVAQSAGAFLRGIERHRVRACGKHFPGLGSVPLQNSPGLAVSGKSMAALWREDLLPYRQLLPRLPMVLISPGAYKAYDLERPRPASLSTGIMQGLLRVKLGYRGLALAYELESEEVRGGLGLGEAAIQSLNAGCDLLVVDQGDPFESVHRALQAGLESGQLSTRRVKQSLARVRAAKRGLALPAGRASRGALDLLARRGEDFSKKFRPEELKIA